MVRDSGNYLLTDPTIEIHATVSNGHQKETRARTCLQRKVGMRQTLLTQWCLVIRIAKTDNFSPKWGRQVCKTEFLQKYVLWKGCVSGWVMVVLAMRNTCYPITTTSPLECGKNQLHFESNNLHREIRKSIKKFRSKRQRETVFGSLLAALNF